MPHSQNPARNAEKLDGDVCKALLVGGAEAEHISLLSVLYELDPRLQSHTENAEASVLNEVLYKTFAKALKIPDDEKRKGEIFPIWATLKGLFPAYLAMDECNPIRDQGLLYAELLADEGIRTRTDYCRGLPNMFVQFPDLPTTLVAGGHLAGGIAWLLQGRK